MDRPLSSEKAARRQRILDAAVETFAARGFASSRTREIAEAAGVAEGTIYLYFEGKDDLLLTAFRERVTDFCAAVDGLLESAPGFDERLRRFVELQFAGIEGNPSLATLLLLEARQTSRFYGAPVRAVRDAYAAAVDRLIGSGIEEGRVRPDVDVALARKMLIGSLEEIELDWLLGPRSPSLAGQAGKVARAFMRGIDAAAIADGTDV